MRAQGRAVAVGEMTEQEQEELRLRRIQEKNRRNQRKFRARQRVRPLSLVMPHIDALMLHNAPLPLLWACDDSCMCVMHHLGSGMHLCVDAVQLRSLPWQFLQWRAGVSLVAATQGRSLADGWCHA